MDYKVVKHSVVPAQQLRHTPGRLYHNKNTGKTQEDSIKIYKFVLAAGFAALASVQSQVVEALPPPPVLLSTTKSGVLPIIPSALRGKAHHFLVASHLYCTQAIPPESYAQTSTSGVLLEIVSGGLPPLVNAQARDHHLASWQLLSVLSSPTH